MPSEQLNFALNCAEQLSVVHGPQDPVIFVVQSVFCLSKWHLVPPPLEMSAQGWSYPGTLATAQPSGIGISHVRPCSPLTMPMVHMDSD